LSKEHRLKLMEYETSNYRVNLIFYHYAGSHSLLRARSCADHDGECEVLYTAYQEA
jgi:hypothetical protein